MAKDETPPPEEPDDAASEYDHFLTLTKRVLTVTKKDLDDAVAREKAKRD